MFPTTEESQFNADAPILDVETIEAWQQDALLRYNLRTSYERWLSFCGITRINDNLVIVDYKINVWGGFNHNWLRITRILKSLAALGLMHEAKEFYGLLCQIRDKIEVSERTWEFWSSFDGHVG